MLLTLLTVTGSIVIFFGLLQFFSKPLAPPAKEQLDREWQQSLDNSPSQLSRMLLQLSKPLGNLPIIYEANRSPFYKAIQAKLLAADSLYGSVEVFIALQALSLYIAITAFVVILVAGLSGIPMICLIILGGILVAYPYTTVSDRHKKRSEEILRNLPDFAELLLMPLRSGRSAISAIEFTTNAMEGPVVDEMRNLLLLLRSREVSEEEAFELVAARLGSPEAQAFVRAIQSAHFEGSRLVEAVSAQAVALRSLAFQQVRTKIKKLDSKLTIIIGAFLLPPILAMIVIAMIPSLGVI